MVRVLIIDKTGNKKNTEIKKFKKKDLYKKCNLRKADDFKKRCTWKMKNSEYYVSIYAKDKGRANSENKYDLPPPIDTKLYFGSLLLIKHVDEELTDENSKDLILEDWEKLYKELFGGFEDLNEEDSYSEEEEIPEHLKTKEGYSKEDGFVVDDGEEDTSEESVEEEDNSDISDNDADEEDEDEEIMGKESDIDSNNDDDDLNVDDNDLDEISDDSEYDSDVGSELSEESYIDSD